MTDTPRPTLADLDTTVRTLQWLAMLAEEMQADELGDALTLAGAFARATRAHSDS